MIARGQIYWLDPDPTRGSEQSGRRPAVVVSRDAVNRSSPVVIVIPITTHRGQKLYPSDVLIEAEEGGLKHASIALGLQIRCVDKGRLAGSLGSLADTTMKQLEKALLQVLDIEAVRHVETIDLEPGA